MSDKKLVPLLTWDLSEVPSVVEYSAARRLLWLTGTGAAVRRHSEVGDDYLDVFRLPSNHGYTSLFLPPADRQNFEKLGSLYVDEGIYSDCLMLLRTPTTYSVDEAVRIFPHNMQDMELVDGTDLLRMLVQLANPLFHMVSSPFMGSGRSQRWYSGQAANELIRLGQIGHLAFTGRPNQELIQDIARMAAEDQMQVAEVTPDVRKV